MYGKWRMCSINEIRLLGIARILPFDVRWIDMPDLPRVKLTKVRFSHWLMKHPLAAAPVPFDFSSYETRRIEYRNAKRFRGSSDEAKTICQRERSTRGALVLLSQRPDISYTDLPRILRKYTENNGSRSVTLLAVSPQTNDRIHPRAGLSWRQKEKQQFLFNSLSDGFFFLSLSLRPLSISGHSGRYYCPRARFFQLR